jgi:hypothetical protein
MQLTMVDIPEIKEELDWLRGNPQARTDEVPDEVLDLVDGSTPSNIQKSFSQFAILAYMQTHMSHMEAISNQSLQNLDEITLYVFRLYSVFWLEKLRRLESVTFTPFVVFEVDTLENHTITILEPTLVDENETVPKEVKGGDFIGGFQLVDEDIVPS